MSHDLYTIVENIKVQVHLTARMLYGHILSSHIKGQIYKMNNLELTDINLTPVNYVSHSAPA